MAEKPDLEKITKIDWAKITDVEKARRIMANAEKEGYERTRWDAFRHICKLSGQGYDDELARDFYQTLAAYEELLTDKNGRTTRASRTRQKLENKGLLQCLEDWALAKSPTMGFELLVSKDLVELTGEFLVLKYRERFSEEAIQASLDRLTGAGVSPGRLPRGS